MANKTQMRLQQLTGSLIDLAYSGSNSSAASAAAIVDTDLGAVLGQFAGAIGRISGKNSTGTSAFTNVTAGHFHQNLHVTGALLDFNQATEIKTAAGNLTLESAADIILDAKDADVSFKDDGTAFVKFTNSSGDCEIINGSADGDIKFKDAGGNEVFRMDGGEESLLMASGKKLMLGAAEEYVSGDGTDITFVVGAGGDINLPADIGLTFGDDGEKIEGDGTNLAIASSGELDLTATGLIDINGSANLDVDITGTVAIDATSTFSVDAVGTSNVTTNGALTLSGSTGINVYSHGGDVDIDSTNGAVDLVAGTTVSIDGASGINLGTSADTAIDVDSSTFDLDASGAITIDASAAGISLDAAAASNFSTSAGALTLTSAAATTWSTSAGALVIDGAAGLTLDSDGTDAVNLGTEAVAKTITIGNAASTKVDVNALALDFDSAAATDILAATTLTAKGATGASFGDDTGTWEFDGSGALSETGVTTVSITPSSTFDIDAGGAVTIDGSAITIGADDSGVAIVLGHGTSEVSVMDNLTIYGDLTVKGTEHIIDSDHLRVKDPLIILGSGSIGVSSMGAIGFASGSSTAKQSLIFGNLGVTAANTFAVARQDIQDGELASSSLDYSNLVNFRAARLEAGNGSNFLNLDGGNLGVTSSADIRLNAGSEIVLDPNGGTVIFQQAGTTSGHISADGSDLKFEDASQTEIFRLDSDQDSLLMAGSNKLQFADSNSYINQDGTDLQLVTTTDINLKPAADLLVDAGGDVILDAGGTNVVFKSAGNQMLDITYDGGDALFKDADGTEIFRIDKSADSLLMASGKKIELGDANNSLVYDGTDVIIDAANDIRLDAGAGEWQFYEGGESKFLLNNSSGDLILSQSTAAKDFIFNVNPSGGSSTEYFRIASSNAEVVVNEGSSNSIDFRVETGNYANALFVDAAQDAIGMGSVDGSSMANTNAVLNISASYPSVGGLQLSGDGGASVSLGDFLQVVSGTAQTETLVINNEGALQIASAMALSFNGSTNTMKITANNGSNMNINAPGDIVFNAGGLNVSPENSAISLGATDAEWANVYTGLTGSLFLGITQQHSIADGNTGLLIDSSEAIEINSSAGPIKIGSDDIDQDITFGAQGVRTITVGNDASTKVDVNALAIELDSAGTIVTNSVTTTDIVAATALTLTAGAASTWSTSAGDLTIDAAAASLVLDSGEASTADSVRIVASHAAGGIDMDSGTSGYNNTSTGALQLTSSVALHDAGIAIVASGEESGLVIEAAGNIEVYVGGNTVDSGYGAFAVLSGSAVDNSDNTFTLLTAEPSTTPNQGVIVMGLLDAEAVTAAEGGGKNGSLLFGSSSMNGFSAVVRSAENGSMLRTGGQHQSQILAISGSKLRFADDYVTGSNMTLPYMQLADSRAEYNSFASNFGAAKSLIGAINSNASAQSSASKVSGSISGVVAAGTAVGGANKGMSTVDLSSLTDEKISKQVDLYVNGQLLMSGTEAQRSAGSADYLWSTVGASGDFKLSFALAADDVIQVTIR